MVVNVSDLKKKLLSDLDMVLPEVEKFIDAQLEEEFPKLNALYDSSQEIDISLYRLLENLVDVVTEDLVRALQDKLVSKYSTKEDGTPNWEVQTGGASIAFRLPSN